MNLMTRLRRMMLAAIAVWPVLLSFAASAAEQGGDRQAIADERDAVEARFRTRVAGCKRRFLVTACVDTARSERSADLERLRARQRGLDEIRRRERAADRSEALRRKAMETAVRPVDRADRPADASGRAPLPRREPAPEPRLPSARSAPEPTPLFGSHRSKAATVPAAERREAEKRSRLSFEARQQRAAEHRDAATSRETQLLLRRPMAAPLPVPQAASAVTGR